MYKHQVDSYGNKIVYKNNDVFVLNNDGLNELISSMKYADKFMGNDLKLHSFKKESFLFFSEYIPRILGFITDIKLANSLEDI